jgi:uncharacterized protein (TIGR02147 family)
MDPNKSIINYTDYRKYLREYYAFRKKETPYFSYQVLADQSGLSSASFVRMVAQGTKSLTKESVAKLAKGLRLTKKMTEYFEHIVFFSQAKDLATRELYLKKIDRFRLRNKPELLLPEEYDYLKNWLHTVVRELVDLKGFTEDYEQCSKAFVFPVSAEDIKKSMDFLVKHGFLQKNADNKLVKREKTISTKDIPQDDEVVLIAKKYHLKMLEMAAKAIVELPRETRSITNTTLSFSESSYQVALKRIENLRFELLSLAASDKEADRVCQLNINLFPLVKSQYA